MSYVLNIKSKGNYLHAAVNGVNTPGNVAAYVAEVHDSCIERRCPNVLIEENLQGPGLGVLSIHDIVNEASQRARPPIHRIAYVDTNPDHDRKAMQFAETVAVNRGVKMKSFASVKEAEQWLVDQIGKGRDRAD